jgi:16S rRNA (guanine527-N7)-methyltransferase
MVNDANVIFQYFPDLTDKQKEQFTALAGLYSEWNAMINVISRKDIDNLYVHHVLHSLAIAKFTDFKPESRIIDLGTGGGFPGVPLAILMPEVHFTLVDSINKKLNVIKAVAEAIGLENVTTQHTRIEDVKEKYDFVVTRAVAKIDKLLPWSRKVLSNTSKNTYPNGLIALKGDIKQERKLIPKFEYVESEHLIKYFNDPYFEEKYVMYVQG